MHEIYVDDPEPLPAEEHFSFLHMPATQESLLGIIDDVNRLTATGAVQHLTNKSKSVFNDKNELLTVRMRCMKGRGCQPR